jgi:hypothetical protein
VPWRDRVLGKSGTKRRRRLRAGAAAANYTSPDGYRVEVAFSESYADDPSVAQAFVDFLASNWHDFELGKLRLFIGTPAEISRLCEGDEFTLACYVSSEDRMYIPGEQGSLGVPIEAPITHEYGHHLASWRRNDPWDPIDWGPKVWSSYESVCANVRAGRYFPGNQGEHYADDPGEGFAESYAFSQGYTGPWEYNPGFEPDEGSFAAIRDDALTPWTGNEVKRFRGRLSRRRHSKTFRLRQPYDGAVRVRLKGPRRANFNLKLIKRGRTVKRTRRRGSRDRLKYRWCSGADFDTIVIKVVRKRGSGRFRVRVSWPG